MVGVGEEFRWCIYNGWFKVGRGGNCKGEGGMGGTSEGEGGRGIKEGEAIRGSLRKRWCKAEWWRGGLCEGDGLNDG